MGGKGAGAAGIFDGRFCCKVENKFCRGGPGSRHLAHQTRPWPAGTWSVRRSCDRPVEAVASDVEFNEPATAGPERKRQEDM